MTPEEARIFLGITNLELDPEDAYLDRLHELKQQFVQQVPFKKLYESRWKRMENIERAYEILAGSVMNDVSEVEEDITFDSDDSLRDLFSRFYAKVNYCKRAIYNSNSIAELLSATKTYYQCYFRFAALFKDIPLRENNKLSQFPDEMALYEELKELSDNGIVKLEDINMSNASSVVVGEMNRLSLWFKKENDE